jgi:hypothetical protein
VDALILAAYLFRRPNATKKADVAEYPEVFDHVGLLFNEPHGTAGLLFS